MTDTSVILKNILISEYGYTLRQAEFIASDINELHAELKPVFESWLKDQSNISDYSYAEFSINSFMNQFGMNFIAALLTMDWILKEPDEAISQIKIGIM
jgi:hypothetical protein